MKKGYQTFGRFFVTGTAASLLFKEDAVRGVALSDGRELFASSVIVATGGLSYPKTGSTGDGKLPPRHALIFTGISP